jgi:hypothetical protein
MKALLLNLTVSYVGAETSLMLQRDFTLFASLSLSFFTYGREIQAILFDITERILHVLSHNSVVHVNFK